MRIAVIGAGYVGLTSAAGFAGFGHDVICADIDTGKIDKLRGGQIPFHEPGLPELVQEGVRAGRLAFEGDVARATTGADVAFLAVGTPAAPDGRADLSHVLAAADAVGRAPSRPPVLVTKSTVPVGTTERVRDAIRALPGSPVAVAANPEFLKEGTAVSDFQRPDRVILGVEDEQTGALLRQLYRPFVRDAAQILVMDLRSAELTKYASNAMLATRISFMNEMATLCERLGADIDQVRKGVGADQRIGDRFLYAGIGFGGSCFGKDVRALLETGRVADAMPRVAAQALATNLAQRQRFVQKIERHFGGNLHGKRIAVWGLAFKPGTDDMRDAPAIDILEALLLAGATFRASDPEAIRVARQLLPGVPSLCFVEDPYEAARGADALALLTEWRSFRQPDWQRLKETMAAPVLFDGRNAWDREAARAAGFTYYGIGRSA